MEKRMIKSIPYFRGISENTGRWLKGWLVVDEYGKHFILSGKYSEKNGVKYFRKVPVKPETVSKLVYADDKYEIYDGDVIVTNWGTKYVLDGEKLKPLDEDIMESDIRFWINAGYMNESRIIKTIFDK